MSRVPDVVVIGGAGHIGLPLSINLARYCTVGIFDIDSSRLDSIRRCQYPHEENGGQNALVGVQGSLLVEDTLEAFSGCTVAILATYEVTPDLVATVLRHLPRTSLIVIRSTVPLGTTREVMRSAAQVHPSMIDVVYCPERSTEGRALQEASVLPQLIGCDDAATFQRVCRIFAFAPRFVHLSPEETEAAKLVTNAYRYAHFAIANDLYASLLDSGIDANRVFSAAKLDYPRMASLPSPGFVGGPCLRKDTLSFLPRGDGILSAALRVNDGMPNTVVKLIKHRRPLNSATVGLLGYTFKAGSDDPRCSPVHELARLLASEAHSVLYSDAYLDLPGFVSFDELVASSDIVIVVTPHDEYRGRLVNSTTFRARSMGHPGYIIRNCRSEELTLQRREQ